MLHDRFGLVSLDSLRHHVCDVSHNGCSEFKVEVTLNSLLGDGLSDAFRVTAFKLPG